MVRLLSENKLKPLFIGFGNQALKYADVLNVFGINIAGVCVKNLKKNYLKFKKYNIENQFNTLDDALKSNCYNTIFIFLPWNLIEKNIEKILKFTNKKIFCEKPLALSLSKLKKIKLISDKNKSKLYLLYNRRFYQTMHFLKTKSKNIINAKIMIPERKKSVIKVLGKSICGKIKFHYTSHWIDFFKFLLDAKIISFKKKNNFFYFTLKKKNKIKFNVKLFYSENRQIEATIFTNKKRYKLITLEKLYEFSSKNNRFKIKINEKKLNKFKPGLYNLISSIINNKLKEFKKIDELIEDYKFLKLLPY